MVQTQRVGVLTFHRCINYGSYWQARCLVEGLRDRGHDAVLLDHQSDRINLLEWRCALHPIPDAKPNRQAYVAKARKFFAAFEELPLSRPIPLEAPEQGDAHDLVVVGSDEVWNLRHPWFGGRTLFYGEGLRTRRLAAYAASFGNQSSQEGLEAEWAERLRRFEAISVRDANSQDLVQAATGHRPPLVLDPCLQFPQVIPRTSTEEGDYLLAYGHGFPSWFTDAVRRWARGKGLGLISVGYDNPAADEQRIDAGPDEFAALMAGATAVVTNFFHGCVFALLNGKPFVTAPSDYRANKVRDLMVALGAQSHMVGQDTVDAHYNHMLGRPLDPQIAQRIAALRQASEGYLDGILT